MRVNLQALAAGRNAMATISDAGFLSVLEKPERDAKAATELSQAVSPSRHAGRDSTDRPSARRPPGVRRA